MKRVRVLLRDDVKDLGRCGDVVNVTPGYARNYLLPNRVAVPATPDNVKMMQRRRVRLEAEEAAVMADVRRRIDNLSGVILSVSERADENGHLFGSVSASIVAKLLTDKGFETEERAVRLDQPIKEIGLHEVHVHVRGEQTAVVRIEVSAKL